MMFIDESSVSKASKTEQMKRQNSILDVVMEQAQGLQKTLGNRDRSKLDEYFDSVRTLEKKIQHQAEEMERRES